MTGLLDPKFQEVFQGRAEVRNTFKVPKVGRHRRLHGHRGRDSAHRERAPAARQPRHPRRQDRLAAPLQERRRRSPQGFECGIGIEKFQDIKQGDIIEAYTSEEVAPVL